MKRRLGFLLAGLLFVFPWRAPAGEKGVEGNWKITFFPQGQAKTLWILKIESKDDKWKGTILSAFNKQFEDLSKLQNFEIKGDKVRFVMKLPEERLQFEFKVADKGSKLLKGFFS